MPPPADAVAALLWPAPRALPSLAGDEVHVWCIPLAVPPAILPGCERLLSAEERRRADLYCDPARRTCFVAARAALRALVAAVTGGDAAALEIRCAPHGKPVLADDRLRFNLSHSGGVALVALARRREVGVDVERVRPGVDCDQLAERYLARGEAAQLRRLPAEERRLAFWHCWVRKEAYLKATGQGLRLGLDRFEVSVWPDPPALRWSGLGPGEANRWTLWPLQPASGYVAALATEGPPARVCSWCWDWTERTLSL